MSRESLDGLAADVRRLLAAGAGVAAGDDRALRKHAGAVPLLGAKVPALAVLADAIDRARTAEGEQQVAAILDLSLLLRRVRAGLATAGLDGTLAPAETSGPWTTDLRLDEPVFTNLLPELADPKARPLNALILADHEEMGTELRLVGPLLAGLEHPDRDAPKRIASILPHFGKAIAPELLRDFDPAGERADAMRLRALSRIEPEAARAACREALARGSEAVREEALDVLRKIDPAEAEQRALALLADPATSAGSRKEAMETLRVARSDAALDALLAAIDAPDAVWSAAAEALQDCPHSQTGARLFGLLQAALADADGAEIKAMGRALRLMPVLIERRHPEALREFLSWLDHRTKELRDWARKQIRYLYERGEPVIPELVATLRHKDPQVIDAVMNSLMRFGSAAAAATPRLIELLGDRRVGTRETAATTLGAVGAGRPDAVAALAAALRDDSPKVRQAAAESLGRFGPAAESAVPALTQALNDAHADVCSAAVRALGRVGPSAAGALPAVLALQHHEYSSVRHQSLGVLACLGTSGIAEVVARLRDPAQRAPMISALSRFAGADPAIVAELVAILRDRANPNRAGAAAVLGDFRTAARPAIEPLVEALNDEDDPLREVAADALATLSIQAKEIVVPLAEVLVPALARAVTNGTYRVRRDACQMLERLGEAAGPAIPALTAARDDPDFIVRQCARAALRAIPASA